jgi:hypothetical protein
MHVPTLSACVIVALSLGALSMQDAKPKRFTHAVSKDADGGWARYMETMKPGPAHERLKELVGSYDLVMRVTMEPGKPPTESAGSSEIGWLTEGKWLQEAWQGSMMGMEIKGTSILGYDNFKQRYVWCKVDSMQTAMTTASGHFDRTGDHLTLWGTIDEPLTPEQDKQVKYVYRGYGQDKFILEVHDMMIGETDTKVIEIEYRRKKR